MSRPWTVSRLTETMWRVLELAQAGLPLDHDITGNRVLWGGRLQVILNLRHHGLIDADDRITPMGLDAFVPKVVKKRPDNVNKGRRDRCLKCSRRKCYHRIWTDDGTYDEVACHDHYLDLRSDAAAKLDDGKFRHHLESSEKMKRATRLST